MEAINVIVRYYIYY